MALGSQDSLCQLNSSFACRKLLGLALSGLCRGQRHFQVSPSLEATSVTLLFSPSESYRPSPSSVVFGAPRGYCEHANSHVIT